MKRILVAVFSIMMLLSFINTTEARAEKSKEFITVHGSSLVVDKVNVNLNGKKLKSDVPGVKYESNTLIPVRALGEELGGEVIWDKANEIATIKTSDKTIELKKGSSIAKVNGKEVKIDNNAKVELISTTSSKGASTMAPLRFISEELGAKVDWVHETTTANITSKKNEQETPVKPEEDKKPVVEEKPEIKLNRIKSVVAKNVDGSKIPEIHIEAESEIEYNKIKENSKTLVIDIKDSLIDEKDIKSSCNAIKKISAQQLSSSEKEKTVRITIELNEELDFYIDDNNKKNLKIKIINKLAGIEKQTIDGKEAIVIRNVYGSKANSFVLSNPNRVVVDVRNTNLNNIGSQISTDVIKELRLAQYTGKEYDPTEKVARVVLDISENYENPKFTTQDRGNDLIIFVEGTKKAPVATVPKDETPVLVPTPPVVTPPTNVDKPTTNQKVIVVDAGHGGHDGGAQQNGLKEKDLTLMVSLKLRDRLESLGYKVIMSRTTDVYPSLSDRYKLANNNNADAFISVHFNSATPSATGIETLFSNKNSGNKGFSQSIQDELIKDTGARNRGLKPRNDLAVLNGTKGISTLVELGFISNPKDAKEIKTDAYKEKVANSIANGVHKYLSK